MGSEELDMVGGGPSHRLDIGITSGRSVQSDQYSRNMPGPKRSEPAKKQRPGGGFGDYADPGKFIGRDRTGFLQNAERDYREGGEGFHLEHRVQKESGGENDERKNAYGGNHLGGMGVGRDQDQWGGGGERDGVGGEGDFRDIGLQGEVSEVSQSEGTEDEDEDDPDLDGEGDEGTAGNRSRESVLGDRAMSHPQMASLEGRMRQESMMGSRSVDGFQRPGSDRDRALKATTSASASFNIYLQPPSLPFINFQQASPSGAHLGSHVEASSAQNGGVGVGGVGSGMPGGGYGMREAGGISRDSYAKSLAARDCAMSSSLHEQQSQGHLHTNLQSSEENYYTSLLNSTASNNSSAQKGQDIGNDVGAGQKRNASRMMDSPSSTEPSLRRILSDPVTGLLMDDASIFGCGHSFGNAGLARVIETNVCTTCGASVRATSMAPNYALRAAVQAYKREEENSLPKLAKRRRDRPDDQGTPVEQQPSSDTSRSKGVQFPFSVSDRVLIKGNKRTPERFVGREAVITNQCLNGWYLVRTLDNGESVRLQYRSLEKLGGQPSPNASHYGSGPGWL